jgi:hypothetical protein
MSGGIDALVYIAVYGGIAWIIYAIVKARRNK